MENSGTIYHLIASLESGLMCTCHKEWNKTDRVSSFRDFNPKNYQKISIQGNSCNYPDTWEKEEEEDGEEEEGVESRKPVGMDKGRVGCWDRVVKDKADKESGIYESHADEIPEICIFFINWIKGSWVFFLFEKQKPK